ncbi:MULTISPECIES: hypothetical protein [unclassified Bradyrhizobium]|uniref:hypothetical protein n=1 Tax=unclassified Bradyrhizobium TaxID=2631580 RepID=UPI0012EB65AC|nr:MULTISPECIES: hypothetical protein [unclassified Bradyrhizobium]QIG98008.1 hypothetical protein G6P99_41225 [Bradyrhizobium sp. 6(2017)]
MSSPLSSWRKPGPITTAFNDERDRGTGVAQQLRFGVMDPGFRKDDTECVAQWRILSIMDVKQHGVITRESG